MSDLFIGIDLGGTRIKAVAANAAGEEVGQAIASTDDEAGVGIWSERIAGLVSQLQGQHGNSHAIGLCAPGLASRDARSIAFMPGRLQGLEHFDWSNFLGQRAHVLNDAHAALLGEVWAGAAAGERDALMLTLGTGVGGAVMTDGHLLRGAIGRAGHLGHITTDFQGAPDIVQTPGSLEAAIGDYSVPARSEGRFQSTYELVAAHGSGDAFASQIWLQSVRALAAGLVSLINAFDPALILLGGGVTKAGDALFQPLHAFLDEMEWRPGGHRVRLAPAQLGERAGALGAAKYAIDNQTQ